MKDTPEVNVQEDFIALAKHHRDCEHAAQAMADLLRHLALGRRPSDLSERSGSLVASWDAHQWPNAGPVAGNIPHSSSHAPTCGCPEGICVAWIPPGRCREVGDYEDSKLAITNETNAELETNIAALRSELDDARNVVRAAKRIFDLVGDAIFTTGTAEYALGDLEEALDEYFTSIAEDQ